MKITLSLLEDASSFINFIKTSIGQTDNLELINVAENLADALVLFSNNPTAIYLIDIQLPDGSGLEVIKKLKALQPEAKFIVCTAFDDDENVFNAIKAGANGYIVKTEEDLDIEKVLLACMQGEAPMSAGIANKILHYFYMLNQQKENVLEELTDKEKNVLDSLSKGFLYKEIASNYNITIDTIKKHCGNIYRKLRVNNRTEAINLYLGR